MPHTIRKKIEAFQWLDFTVEERFKRRLPITQEEYAEKIQVSTRQLSNWKTEHDKVKAEKHNAEGLDDYTPEDWKEYLKSQKLIAAKHLVDEVQKGKVTAIEAFFKLLGEFIEKTEQVNIELSADEYIRLAREADRRIQEANLGTDGSAGLLKEPEVLSS